MADPWYTNPEYLGVNVRTFDSHFLPVIDDCFWDFQIFENGNVRIEPARSLPLDYVFEHPEQDDLYKARLGLSEDDFVRWLDNSVIVKPSAIERRLTDAEAMFFMALKLASPERPVEKVLKEIRAIATNAIAAEAEIVVETFEAQECYTFSQAELQTDNFYNNPMHHIMRSPLALQLQQLTERWSTAFAGRDIRLTMQLEKQIAEQMSSINAALAAGILNDFYEAPGRKSDRHRPAKVHHDDYPLLDPSMHRFAFGLYKGQDSRMPQVPQFDILSVAQIRKLLPAEYKHLAVVLTGNEKMEAALQAYENRVTGSWAYDRRGKYSEDYWGL